MNNRGGRMKGDKIKVVIIYILILIIIALVAYLMYIVVSSNDEKEAETNVNEPDQTDEIADECKFGVTLAEYNDIINNPAEANLCSGESELTITDITVNGQVQNIKVRFYNGESTSSGGVYLNDREVVTGASLNVKNGIGVFDNKLFIFTDDPDDLNVYAYDENGTELYNLKSSLADAQITDPALSALAQNNANISTIVNSTNIDGNTMNFGANEFTFSTISGAECVSGSYSGSSYRVTFSGSVFNTPEFVTTNICP